MSILLSVRRRYSSFAAVAFDSVEATFLSHSDFFTTNDLRIQLGEGPRKMPEISLNKQGLTMAQEKIENNIKGRTLSFETKNTLKRYSSMFHEYTLTSSLNKGRGLHAELIRSEIQLDSYLWTSLVNFYSKCGCFIYACRVLDEMPERDVVSWTALIQGLVSEGYNDKGLCMFVEMKRDGIKPNEFTLATGLKASSISLALNLGKQMHAETIKYGFLKDLFVGSALVDLYAKCNELQFASKVFLDMPEQNVVTWNALLNGFAQLGDWIEVLQLFSKMTESEMKFSKFTLSAALKGCANPGNLVAGQIIHSLIIRIGHEHDTFMGCSLVDMYSKCGHADEALKVFMGIDEPDVVTWSVMITCLDQQEQGQKVTELFNWMRHRGISPNQFILCSFISAAVHLGDLAYGRSIHASVFKCGFESDISINNSLITMYLRNGSVDEGTKVFELMKSRDLISWNAYLCGIHDSETCDLGPNIFSQMLKEGLRPNIYTFTSVLSSCASLMDVCFGRQIHSHIVKNNLHSNCFVQTAVIDMYAKGNCLEDADLAFDRLIIRDIFTWTIIISAHAQTCQVEKGIIYFRKMLRQDVKPNEFTLSSCLSCCSHVAILETGRQLQSMAVKDGHDGDMFVISTLSDMYVKCGCVEEAEVLFRSLIFPDVVAWNIMICGYSQHGLASKALALFLVMVKEGTMPDKVTFIGVLTACSHQGLVEEGKRYFSSMIRDFEIAPAIEHFACMVDTLGRAGKFDEVEDFIEKMKLTPHALIWETVLGASKMHNNLEIGEKAATKLFELQPVQETNYILLSNIFAAKGRWDDVRKIRSLMSTSGVKKDPGCSWTEVDGQVHVFVSHDTSHPRIQEIHSKLEEMSKKLSLVGYVPKTQHVLHDIADREKREHLKFHSERLALGYALIGNSKKKAIRIFKNLRICEDCHDVMKLMSDITNHEIVVRDMNRFHHFNDGTCSCHDYW